LPKLFSAHFLQKPGYPCPFEILAEALVWEYAQAELLFTYHYQVLSRMLYIIHSCFMCEDQK
jgi:hypothetical protein